MTGSRVFLSRVYPLQKALLPGLTVFIQRDEADFGKSILRKGERLLWHSLTLSIDIHAQSNAALDDILDSIEHHIKQALLADMTLGGAVKDIRWLSTDFSVSGEAEKPTGLATLLFQIDYHRCFFGFLL